MTKVITDDNWEDHINSFSDDDFECINDNGYGLSEMRAGRIQDCGECEYYHPTQDAIEKLNNELNTES